MNRVSFIVQNHAYPREVELDEAEVDPVDIAPLVSGDAPIITAPASEDEEVTEDVLEDNIADEDIQDFLGNLDKLENEVKKLQDGIEDILSHITRDTSSQQPAVVHNVDVWDTGKAVEQEYRLYPDSNRKEISDRLSDQVWDLLRILQERVDQHTCNIKDIELIDGLKAILVLHYRLGKLTE